MQRFSRRVEVLIAAFLLLLASACRDELPTAAGEGLFPRVQRGETHVLDVAAADFLQDLGTFAGYTGPRDVPYLMVANRFGGELDAHALIRHTGFPTSVAYSIGATTLRDTVFTYASGQLLAPIDTVASITTGEVEFQLWRLEQGWERGSVSWEVAQDTGGVRTPWVQPGGTRGRLLSTTSWVRGDTLMRDTLAFALDSLTVAEMASEGFPGVLVTATGAPVRMQLGPTLLRVMVRPETHPDTTIAQTVVEGPQTFVFTPEPPLVDGLWQTGGIRSARVLFRLDLGRRFPCPGATGVPPCVTAGDSLGLFEVAVNQASLLLDPVAVSDAFRPRVPMNLLLRTVAEPQLGRRAPLGQQVIQMPVQVQPGVFAEDGQRTPVVFPLLAYLLRLPEDTGTVDLALLAEPEAASFGMARFSPQMRLRVVYTLPLIPVLP